jgi:aldehyde:ferredoxin oxidoreductase
MYGWMGTIIRVDLTKGKIVKEPLSEELRHGYLGGRGINVRILYDEIKPGTDGLAPENILLFGTGPLTGTPVASGRLNITAMSPLTGILGDSNAGSHFAPELKYAGYDHIIFTGKADKPVYLWIDNDNVELRDAQHLWGKMSTETQNAIKKELGDSRIQVTCIGPAGENLVRLASITVGAHGCCGRCGVGAVMGSKNLKAVAVRGTKGVKVADPEALRKYVLGLKQKMMDNKAYETFSKHGSKFFLPGRNNKEGLTIRNGQETGSFQGYDEIKAETLYDRYVVRNTACFGCLCHCRSWFQIKDGPYAGLTGVGTELSIQEAWGSLLDNDYAPSLYEAHILCNEYGLDALQCGQLVAAATEWYQKGIITKKDTQGIELEWGNHKAYTDLVHKIAKREGIGDLLAEDGVRAAQKLGHGAEKCITHSKGVMKTNVDLRCTAVYALAHAIATRGADHLRGGSPINDVPGQYDGIAEQVYQNNDVCTIADALETCKFNTGYALMKMNVEEMVPLFALITGVNVTLEEMKKIGDRIWALERAFIVREGISRKDDTLIGRFMDEPVHGGLNDGLAYDKKKWSKMLDEYYDLVHWDKKTGVPTRESLEELGLKDVADELQELGKL